jgi:protocatechuate 3,4-dioxygenase beta subunit
MDRKKFIKNLGLGALTLPIVGTIVASQSYQKVDSKRTSNDDDNCKTSPRETAGPFPLKSTADVVRENIIGDRIGVPLIINITIQDANNNCKPLPNAFVDIWHCDAHGNYSEYAWQNDGNFTNKNFLRGRQTTDTQGNVNFVSIYPGWYPGRAPHLHIEVLDQNDRSLLVTQIAFPDTISNAVYTTKNYDGVADTSNKRDGVFRNSLNRNMADKLTGNTTDGYILTKVIKVSK